MEEDASDCEDLRVYEVILSPTAERAFKAVRSRVDMKRIDRVLSILDTVPGIGRNYDPLYDAAQPPEDIKVVYAGHYGIYYQVDESLAEVHVYYIEDQRRDQMIRFSE